MQTAAMTHNSYFVMCVELFRFQSEWQQRAKESRAVSFQQITLF